MKEWRSRVIAIVGVAVIATIVVAAALSVPTRAVTYVRSDTAAAIDAIKKNVPPPLPPLDKSAYDAKLLEMSHVATTSPWHAAFMMGTTTASTTIPKPLWPVKRAYPKSQPLLPFNRIVSYYGNFLSKGMGALGKWPEQEMLTRLQAASDEWRAADPNTPVIPALHLIIVTAQASAGKDGMYRARMSDALVDKALKLADQIHGIVFLDFQVGFSTLEKELPQYEKYYVFPNVHVGIDPEFSMKGKYSPGHEIGTFDAAEINWVSNYLAEIVRKNNLPPKVLMIHRFTQDMVTHASRITPLPEVQIVMDMDGWGDPAKKMNTYANVVADEPVQFMGFKLFYVNDLYPPSKGMMTPKEVLKLTPAPVYIQYQ